VTASSNGGIEVITEEPESGQRRLRCVARPEQARCIRFPVDEILPREIPEGPDEGGDNETEGELYVEF
jgi:hypothetical protein